MVHYVTSTCRCVFRAIKDNKPLLVVGKAKKVLILDVDLRAELESGLLQR